MVKLTMRYKGQKDLVPTTLADGQDVEAQKLHEACDHHVYEGTFVPVFMVPKAKMPVKV